MERYRVVYGLFIDVVNFLHCFLGCYDVLVVLACYRLVVFVEWFKGGPVSVYIIEILTCCT